MKFRWGIVAAVTVLFLFGGLYFIGMEKAEPETAKNENSTVFNSEYAFASVNKLSIKQIDSLSAAYNISFTSSNAKLTSLNSVSQ